MLTRPCSIVFCVWNCLHYLDACIASLQKVTDRKDMKNIRIIAVDNGSKPDTINYLRNLKQKGIIHVLIENGSNLGFSKGNNIGIKAAGTDDVLLLNTDTEIIQSTWLSKIQETAYSKPEIGVVGCRQRNAHGFLMHAGSYMLRNIAKGAQIGWGLPDVNQYNTVREVEGVVGSCMYIKREVIDKIGGLPEEYESYYEDTVFCLKAKEVGYSTYNDGRVTIIHHQNVSTRENKVSFDQIYNRSRSIFIDSWHPKLINKYNHQIAFRTLAGFSTGYGQASKNMIVALDRNNVDVRYDYIYGVTKLQGFTDWRLQDVALKKFDNNIPQVTMAQGDALYKNSSKSYRIGYTMLETNGLPKEWVDILNDMDEVWTCLTPETLIRTNIGYFPIKDIKISDSVISHKGKEKKVTGVMSREINEEIYNIKTNYGYNIRITDNHPILIYRPENCEYYNYRKCSELCSAKDCDKRNIKVKTNWIRAREVKEKDFVIIPKYNHTIKDIISIKITDILKGYETDDSDNLYRVYEQNINHKNQYKKSKDNNKVTKQFHRKREKFKNTIPLNEEILKLFGYWIAEGCYDNFSLHIKEKEYREDIISIVKKYFNLDYYSKHGKNFDTPTKSVEKGNGVGFTFCNATFGKLMQTLFGKGCWNKKIPDEFLGLPKNKLLSLLKGMIRGDGSETFDSIGYSSVSEKLIWQINEIYLRLGYIPRIGNNCIDVSGKQKRESKELCNIKYDDIMISKKIEKLRERNQLFFEDDKNYYIPITKITKETYNGRVYNISVEKDESYIANNITVHNCTKFNKETFTNAGVTKPIHVVPLGVDPELFNPDIKPLPKNKNNKRFTFVSCFEYGERKAPEILLKAFNEEFSSKDNVQLLLKINNNDKNLNVYASMAGIGLKPSRAPIYVLYNTEFYEDTLGSFYRNSDCFVSATMGEGWGMPQIESAACGLPVITTGWSGVTEFLNKENGTDKLLVDYKLIPAVARCPYYEGQLWAQPKIEDLKAKMRWVYEHQDEAKEYGLKCSQTIREKYSWDNSAKIVIDRLKTIGY